MLAVGTQVLSARARVSVLVFVAALIATATATATRPRTIAAANVEPTSVTVQPDHASLSGSVQVEVAAGSTKAIRLWLQGWPTDMTSDDLRAHVNATADAAFTCSVVGTRVGQLVPTRQLECMINATERFADPASGNVVAFASPLVDAKCPDDEALKAMGDELRAEQEAVGRNVSAVDEQLQRVADSAALLERAKEVYFQLPPPHSPRGSHPPRADGVTPGQVPPPSLTELLDGVNQLDAARAKNDDRRRDLLAQREALVKTKASIVAAFAALRRKSSVVELELQCAGAVAPFPSTPSSVKVQRDVGGEDVDHGDDDADDAATADPAGPPRRRRITSTTKKKSKTATHRVEVAFEVTTRQASWRPSYDLRLDSAGTQHELDFLADVQQWTGRDWSNVSLTVTTAQVSRGSDAALPPVPRLVVKHREEFRPSYRRHSHQRESRRVKEMSADEAQRAHSHMAFAADEMDAGAPHNIAAAQARGAEGGAKVYGAASVESLSAPVIETIGDPDGPTTSSPTSAPPEAAPAKQPSWSAGNVFETTLQHRADVPSARGAAVGATVPVALSLRVEGALTLVAHPDVSTAVFQRANLSNVDPQGISLLSGRSRIYVDGHYAADGTLPALPAGGASVDLDVGKVRGLLVRRTTLADETVTVKTGLLGLGDAVRRSTQRRRVEIVNEGFRVDQFQRANAAPPDVLVRVAVPVARIPKLVVSTPGAVRGCASAEAPERGDEEGADEDKPSVAAHKQAERRAARAECVKAARYAGFVPDAPTGGKNPAAVERLETYLSIPLRTASDDEAGTNLEGTPSARSYEVLLESPASEGDDIVVVSPDE